MKIYTASKTKHADKWLQLRESGVNVISTWIDEAGVGASPDLADLCERCIKEALSCDAMIVYSEDGDYLKGAFIEMGVALTAPIPIVLVGPVLSEGSVFTHHPSVFQTDTIENAVVFIHNMDNHPEPTYMNQSI